MDRAWWDTLPDGNLYATWDLEGPVRVESTSHLNALLDTVSDLAGSNGIGQIFNLNLSFDEVLVVWLDVPGGAGWALNYDNSLSGTSMYTVGQAPSSSEEETVSAKYADSWEEIERRCFVEPQRAREEVVRFFETREAPASSIWQQAGADESVGQGT